MPLNGRNVLQLQVLVPGSVSGGSLDQGAGTPGYAVNGGIAGSNMYSLDGGEYQDAYFNAPLPFPNPDAIQEFTIQTNSYSAEFGRNRGASINAVTKSGSNEFHGGAFAFVRNDHFDARPFFSTTTPVFKRNQFGADQRPHSQEQNLLLRRLAGHEQYAHRVPPSVGRHADGDFTQLLPAKQLIDPLSKAPLKSSSIESRQTSRELPE